MLWGLLVAAVSIERIGSPLPRWMSSALLVLCGALITVEPELIVTVGLSVVLPSVSATAPVVVLTPRMFG